MSTDAWDRTSAGWTSWAEAHPGRAAWVAALATYAGVALVAISLSTDHPAGGSSSLWVVPLLLLGGATFVVALPAALGFAGACCATQRELTAGVLAGLVVAVLALVVVAVIA